MKVDFQTKFSFRFDATALGETEGPIELKDARFSHWLQDAEEVLVHLTEGPQLVIGSSMGGWVKMSLLFSDSLSFPCLFERYK